MRCRGDPCAHHASATCGRLAPAGRCSRPERGAGVIPLSWYLALSAGMFCLGTYGVLGRRNAVAILMGIELMLNAVNINLVAFWRYLTPNLIAGHGEDDDGE